jgi:tyrosyl-tRNA synthetase
VAAGDAVFGSGQLAAIDERTLEAAVAELPRTELSDKPPAILDLLVDTGLARSRGDARRIVGEGGAYINNRRLTDPAHVPDDADFLHGRWLFVRRGKRQLAVVERRV